MMVIKRIHSIFKILLFLFLTAFIFTCKKKKEDEPVVSSANEIGEVFNQQGVPLQTFTVSNAANVTKYTNAGNYFVLSANTFVDANGKQVTGNIDVEVKEAISKKEFIYSNLTTKSGNNYLVSGGMMYFGATQNGNALKLAPGKTINTFIKATLGSSIAMKKYYDAVLPKNPGDGNADWTLSIDTTAMPLVIDSLGANSFYFFKVTSLGWINCDYFYSNPNPTTTVTINLSETYTDKNCAVFFSVDGKKVIGGSLYNNANGFTISNIPVSTAVSFVAIAKVNNQYFFAVSSNTVVANLTQSLNLYPTNAFDIKTALENLP